MIKIEPISQNNVSAVWDLYQRTVSEIDRIPRDWFILKTLGDPDYSPELMLAAIEYDVPIGFMMAVCREEEGEPVGWLKAWGTELRRQGEGIASMLLAQAESKFRTLGAKKIRVGQAKPNYITPGIDANEYTPAIGFLLRRGFVYKAMSYNMNLPLEGQNFAVPELEKKLADMGVIVRRVEVGEKDRFVANVTEDGWPYSWQYQSGTACDAQPPAAFVAEKEGKFEGFAVYDGVRPGWFGPTGTSESLRGSGIGSLLFFKCIEDMQRKGYEVCRICAVGPLYFYSKVAGAKVSRTFWLMEKELSEI